MLPLTTRQLARAVEAAANMAEIKKRVTPHTLRHYAESRIMPSCLWIAVAAAALSPRYSA
jgi:integrase